MRVLVVGISGAGKTALARRIAARHGLPHIELDAHYWGPDWTPFGHDATRASVAAAVAAPAWVADGYYVSVVGDLVWPRATHLVWLDYPRGLIMARVVRRSLLRAITRRPLWNGNRERWSALFDRDHPIRYAWRNALPRRAAIEARLALAEHAHLVLHRLRHPREAALLPEALRPVT